MPGTHTAQALGVGIDFPHCAELPAERPADRFEDGGVHLDRPIRFRKDPGDRVLHTLEIARVGALSARPLDVRHRHK